MAISIIDRMLPYETHNLYDVTFFNDEINTLVTHTPSFITDWISDTEHIHRDRLHRLIVGLDVEWRPSFNRYVENPAATLQLCVGRRCLIVQLIYAAPSIPQELFDFLQNPNYTFVGVGIESDVEKLIENYGLSVARMVDLRRLAADEHGMRNLINAGLKTMALEILGKEIEKPRAITMSRWDTEWLSSLQVQYACVDAFLSFEIGKRLNASDH